MSLRTRLRALRAATQQTQHATPLRDEIAKATTTPPLAGPDETALSPEQSSALEGLLAAIEALEVAFDRFDAAQPYVPLPEPSMRVRPPL